MTQMLKLPDWYEGGYPDAEELVMRYFKWLTNGEVFCCTWLPPGHYVLSPGEELGGTQPTLRIWRQPGTSDPDLRRDQALVQIACITPTRFESWKLTQFVRRMMEHDNCAGVPVEMPDGEMTSIAKSAEWVGPQLVPEQMVDEKFIPVTFKIDLREPADLPNYRRIINNLPR